MKIAKALILTLTMLVGLAVSAPAQARAGGGGGAMGTRSPIGNTQVGTPNWDDGKKPVNPNAELNINEKLATKLKTLLPQDTSPGTASKGFGELKEFVATVRAANNLGVAFSELKGKMADGSSKELQKAIHQLKPDVDAKAEVKKANEQAKQDIKESKAS